MAHAHIAKEELIAAVRTLKKLHNNTRDKQYRDVQESIVKYAWNAARFGESGDISAEDAREIAGEYKRATR